MTSPPPTTKSPQETSAETSPRQRKPRWAVGVIVAALLLHAGLAFDVARRWSATNDEYWHLPVGLLNLRTGRFDYDTLNPPLLRMLAAVPVWLAGGENGSDELSDDTVVYGDRFFEANGERTPTLFLWGRCVIILLSVAGGAVLSWWAWKLAGPAAGVTAALLWCGDPTVLANAALVTTDLPAAVWFVWTLFALWDFAEEPNCRRAIVFGLALGTAQLVKYTCVILLPVSVVLWFVLRWGKRETGALTKCQTAVRWLAALAVCLGCWNAGYLFQGSFARLDSYKFSSQTMQRLAERFSWAGAVPVPLPRDYVLGLDKQRRVMEGQHPVYLDGQLSTEPFPGYYGYALAYKLPHPTQLLFLAALLTLFVPRWLRKTWRRHVFFLLPSLLLFAIASTSRMQLGIRYLLPVLPLLMIWCATVLSREARVEHRKPGQGPSIIDWCVVGIAGLSLLSLRCHPDELGYFNELSGGPEKGHQHLLDSNIDWGQDLSLLKPFMEEQGIAEIGLVYFGTVSPQDVGIEHHLPPRANVGRRSPVVVPAGWYAVSVNFLMGRPHVARDAEGHFQAVGPYEFAYFQRFKPAQKLGSSLWVFHVRERTVIR